jgi:hypothetical protein
MVVLLTIPGFAVDGVCGESSDGRVVLPNFINPVID